MNVSLKALFEKEQKEHRKKTGQEQHQNKFVVVLEGGVSSHSYNTTVLLAIQFSALRVHTCYQITSMGSTSLDQTQG